MADEKVNMGPEEISPRKPNPRPARVICHRWRKIMLLLFLVKIKRPPIMWSPIRRLPTSTHSRLFFPAWAKIHPPRPAR